MTDSSYNPKRIGRYTIVTRLAVGGMAEIFLARERGLAGLERLVVLKRILPQLAAEESFRDMFLREARLAARLNHPNVVQIYELGEEVDNYYIAMEYIHGSTARELQILAQRQNVRVKPDVAISIVLQSCRGLHAAHELTDLDGHSLGLVHRDVNPHNLMVTPEGNVKLLDFGVAKATQGLDVTYSGALKGKFSYLSPEQLDRKSLDRRSDVFALGIVLWELLTGERLFLRDTEIEMIQAVLEDEIPALGSYGIPEGIERVVMRSLERDRESRYSTVEILRKELAAAAKELGLSVGPDGITAFVRKVAGEELAERRKTLSDAMERTLRSGERERLVHSTGEDGEEPETVVRRPSGSGSDLDRSGVQGAQSEVPVRRPDEETRVETDDIRTRPALAHSLWLRLAIAVVAAAVLVTSTLILLEDNSPAPLTVTPVGDEEPEPQPVYEGEPLVFGWPPYVDPELMRSELAPLRRHLEAALQRPVPFEVPEDYASCIENLASGEYAFAALSPALYIEAASTIEGLQLLAVKEYDGAVGYDGWIVVAERSGYRSLEDLAGQPFCFTDPNSTSGYRLPRAFLAEHGLDPDTFFGEIHWSGQHHQALKDLLDGTCEGAATYNGAVYSAGEAGIPVGRLRPIVFTGSIPQDVITASPHVDPEMVSAMREVLLDFDPQEHLGGPRVGEVQRITGFAPSDDRAFDPLRQVLGYGGEPEQELPLEGSGQLDVPDPTEQ